MPIRRSNIEPPARLHVAISEKPSLSVEEAAALSSVGRTSLYAAMRHGVLRKLKVGRRTLILRTELDRWLAAQAAR